MKKPEVANGATQVYARVEGGGGEADPGTRGNGGASLTGFGGAGHGVAPMRRRPFRARGR